jgi:lipopolysaccharide export system protein LptC
MIARLLPLLALLALIIALVVFSGPQRETAVVTTAAAPPHDPGYSARDARLVQTGADGKPIYTLDAAQIQQQPNRGVVDMQQVQLGFRDTSGNQWTARSRHGELGQDTGIVILSGDVHVSGTLPGTQEATEMMSERLEFDTNAEVASTQDPVTILMSGRKLDATGMTASLKDRRLQLESNVHGTFLP